MWVLLKIQFFRQKWGTTRWRSSQEPTSTTSRPRPWATTSSPWSRGSASSPWPGSASTCWVRPYYLPTLTVQNWRYGLVVIAGLRLGFKAQQCLGQRYGLKTLSTTRKAPFLTKVWSPASSASFGIRTHDPHTRGRALQPLGLYTISTNWL